MPRWRRWRRCGRAKRPPWRQPGAPATHRARPRCDTCGTIRAILHTPASGATPGSYTFTVRMPNGTLRTSTDPLPGLWQVGDGMQLLGGDRFISAPFPPVRGEPVHLPVPAPAALD